MRLRATVVFARFREVLGHPSSMEIWCDVTLSFHCSDTLEFTHCFCDDLSPIRNLPFSFSFFSLFFFVSRFSLAFVL